MKTFATIAAIVVAVLFVGAALVLARMDDVIAESVSASSEERLGVPVTVADVAFSLGERQVEVLGIEVANPPGMEGPPMLAVGRLAAAFDLGRSGTDLLWVRRLEIEDVTVTAVVDGVSEGAMTNIGRVVARSRRAASRQRSREAAGTDDGLRVVVEQMFIRNGHGALVSPLGSTKAQLPEIRMEDIGGSQGISVDELTAEIVGRLADQTNEAVARALIDKIDVEDVVERVKGKLDRFVDRMIGSGQSDRAP